MRKLAVVRNNEEAKCPFGLNIPSACKCAGKHVEDLAPLKLAETDEEQEKIKNANRKFLAWYLSNSTEEIQKCPYADVIVDNADSVVCNYDDAAPGLGQSPLFTPPFYTQMMANNVMGLQSYPITYYGDYNISRNMYYGIFSLQGSEEFEIKKPNKGS